MTRHRRRGLISLLLLLCLTAGAASLTTSHIFDNSRPMAGPLDPGTSSNNGPAGAPPASAGSPTTAGDAMPGTSELAAANKAIRPYVVRSVNTPVETRAIPVVSEEKISLRTTSDNGESCYSMAGANDSSTCEKVVAAPLAQPGDAVKTRVALSNESTSADGAKAVLTLQARSCDTADAGSATFHGSGDVCNALLVAVQEYTDASYSSPKACIYGAANGATCMFADGYTINHLRADDGAQAGSISAGETRYIEVLLAFTPNAGNEMQGRTAGFDLEWKIAS